MGTQRRSETSIEWGGWIITLADSIDDPQPLVPAAVMLDILATIKMDLMVSPVFGADGFELQDRVNRAGVTIEEAILALKRASDPVRWRQSEVEAPIDFDRNAP